MSYFDSLKYFDGLVAGGYSESQARTLTAANEHSFFNFIKEIKSEFVSQKLIGILGALIVIGMTAMAGELWYLSKEVSILSRDMQEVRQHIFSMEKKK